MKFYKNVFLAPCLIVATATALLGCSTTVKKDFSITGNNKNSGIIELSYEYSHKEKPVVDEQIAAQLAIQRCQLWGYQHIQLTQEPQKTCLSSELGICLRTKVSMKYQCK